MVAEFAAAHPKITYFDIATPMLGENGTKPAADWFVSDGLHMKPKGYELWTSIIKPWVDAD
jgi:lysophospholipase L1-like esterase